MVLKCGSKALRGLLEQISTIAFYSPPQMSDISSVVYLLALSCSSRYSTLVKGLQAFIVAFLEMIVFKRLLWKAFCYVVRWDRPFRSIAFHWRGHCFQIVEISTLDR